MYYAISDNEGNAVDSFSDQHQAQAELLALTERHSGETFFLLAYDDDGRPVGEARLAEDLLTRVSLVSAPDIVRISEGTTAPFGSVRFGRFTLTGPARQTTPRRTTVGA